MPLIFVQNETTVDPHFEHWKDIEGVQYHFPNQYKNKIEREERFIYYRGTRRKDGTRGIPEYFGTGTIGKISLDQTSIGEGPKSSLQWFCEILDYFPFVNPVPFRLGDEFFEKIPKNLWGVGVRTISQDVFNKIVSFGHSSNVLVGDFNSERPGLIDFAKVQPELITPDKSLIIPVRPNSLDLNPSQIGNFPRYSQFAKLYGDRAEHIVYKILTDRAEHQLKWVSQTGEKPGWDIEFYQKETKIAVEVKGTSGKKFKNIEITAGEWRAAEAQGENYNLYLVADCLGQKPEVQIINNPFDLYKKNKISISPTNYRMAFLSLQL